MRSQLVCAVLLATLSGCTTTEHSRELAADLSAKVEDYRKDRKSAIDAMNAAYRTTYARLLANHRALSLDLLRLERDADARQMADSLLLNWKKGTTFSNLVLDLSRARARQLQRMDEESAAIAAARSAYAESYSDLKLELKKLQKAKERLDNLSQPEDEQRRTLQFLVQVAHAYNEVRSKREESSQ